MGDKQELRRRPMAVDWSAMFRGFTRHWKHLKLADVLPSPAGVDANVWQLAVMGMIARAWDFLMDFARDGDITDVPPEQFALACGWKEDASKWIEALVAVRILERVEDDDSVRLVYHGWNERQPRLSTERVRKWREKRVRVKPEPTKPVGKRASDAPDAHFSRKLILSVDPRFDLADTIAKSTPVKWVKALVERAAKQKNPPGFMRRAWEKRWTLWIDETAEAQLEKDLVASRNG